MSGSHSDFTLIMRILAIVALVYGVTLLLVPGMHASMGQEPVPPPANWLRWPGGLLVGLGVMTWVVASRPRGQEPLVLAVAIGNTLVVLALLYSALSGEYKGAIAWPIWLPICLVGVLTAALWWLYGKHRDLLKPASP